jgi:outer membrane lipase/esterase
MSHFSTGFALAASAAALIAAAPASAQRVDRIVAFGDSYADDGNLFQLLNIPRPAVYPNGRFSNGTNFIDTMALLLNVPVDNFAIGGAFTNNGNINGPGIPGFVTEYGSFLAGGGPAAFPRVSGRFGPNDLLAISIGGNDARAYERSLGLAPTSAQVASLIAGAPGQANLRVAEATTGLGALVNAGARNITFLAGDVGRLPEVQGLAIAPVGTAYATAFNAGIQTSLANFASQGVIVNYLDLNRIGDVVQANLAAFGLQSAGACPIACVTTNPELLDRYLFYVDQLHLTSAGFAIVGRYAVRQLEAPLNFAAQTDLGLLTASSFGSTLLGRLDLSDARAGDYEGGGIHAFLTGDTAHRDIEAGRTNFDYTLNSVGATGGLEYEAGGAVFGAALNYAQGRSTVGATGKARTRALQAGLYAGWAGGNAFAEAYAGYGWLDYSFERQAVIDRIAADTKGNSVVAGGRAGYLFGADRLRVGPVLGLRYAKADADPYTETGDPVLTLNVRRQEVKALTGSAGAELRGTLDVGGLAVRPYVALTGEKDFEGDSRTIRYAGTASPTIVNTFVLADRSKDVFGRLDAGASFTLGTNIALEVHADTTIERKGGNDLSAFAGVRIGF